MLCWFYFDSKLQALLAGGADILALTSEERGSTGPLFVCTEVGNLEVFEQLLQGISDAQRHAAANQKNGEDLYPVDCAAFYDQWKMVEALLPLTDELKDTPLEEIRETAIRRRKVCCSVRMWRCSTPLSFVDAF